jgi:ParB family transcriptional regulator, chromosome partitioning protein
MTNATGGLRGLSQGRTDIFKVDPRQLHVKPDWNGRDFSDPENRDYIQNLAMSIASVGIKEPLTVVWEDDRAWVINGECRLRAVKMLIADGIDIKTVPVQSEDRFSNDADRLLSQIIRNSGKPFSLMEQAKVFKRLLDLGWEQSDIAVKAGMSNGRISQILGLLCLPESIKSMVVAGEVSAAMAQRTVATAPTQQAAIQTLKDAVVTAKAVGKTRATPKHLRVNGEIEIIDGIGIVEDGDDSDNNKKSARAVDKIVFEAFEHATVDDEMSNDKGEPVVVVTFPLKQWEKIVKALKL